MNIDDEVVYELAEWEPDLRVLLGRALDEEAIPHTWEGDGDLVVRAGDGDRVEAILDELEIRHSRAIVPTRRVALGRRWLPTEPAPGFGGILLAALVATHVAALDDEALGDLHALVDDLEGGRRIAQPRLRHRFQTDTH